MTTKFSGRTKAGIDNRRLAKKRVQYLYVALYFVSSSLLADDFVLQNSPQLLKPPKR